MVNYFFFIFPNFLFFRCVSNKSGLILESLKQYNEAGELYLRSGEIQKAATAFIASRNFDAAEPLMENITTPKLHVEFAKAKEREGDFERALESYKTARDRLSVIRILLFHLNRAEEALSMVRANPFVDGSMIIAEFTHKKGDFSAAIEFHILAKQVSKAFEIAKVSLFPLRFCQMIFL